MCQADVASISWKLEQKESAMHRTTVAVDLAKNRFELAVADEQFRIHQRERLTRARFTRFFVNIRRA